MSSMTLRQYLETISSYQCYIQSVAHPCYLEDAQTKVKLNEIWGKFTNVLVHSSLKPPFDPNAVFNLDRIRCFVPDDFSTSLTRCQTDFGGKIEVGGFENLFVFEYRRLDEEVYKINMMCRKNSCNVVAVSHPDRHVVTFKFGRNEKNQFFCDQLESRCGDRVRDCSTNLGSVENFLLNGGAEICEEFPIQPEPRYSTVRLALGVGIGFAALGVAYKLGQAAYHYFSRSESPLSVKLDQNNVGKV